MTSALPATWVLHADAHWLVLDKPAGLLSVPGRGADKQDCLSARVQVQYPDALVVHRLDMATSGLLLMARGPQAQRALSRAFAERRVHKRYVAVVHGCLQGPTGPDWAEINLPIRLDWSRRPLRVIDSEAGQPSRTRWRVLTYDALTDRSRLELEPLTGRSHQLRVHLQALGHPIVGDVWYGADPPPTPSAGDGAPNRLLLHASALRLTHPQTGECMEFRCPAPF